MDLRSVNVLVGCNKTVGALDWGPSDIVAIGAQNFVALYNPKVAKVVGVLNGHNGQVNVVKWLDTSVLGNVQFNVLLSGSADGTIRLWKLPEILGNVQFNVLLSGSADGTIRLWKLPESQTYWKTGGSLLAVLKGHSSGVTDLAYAFKKNGNLILVSTSGDQEVFVWHCNALIGFSEEHWGLKQKIKVGFKLQHCAAITVVPSDPSWFLLALGGTDSAVHLYLSEGGANFKKSCSLIGHQDWIRSLAFAKIKKNQPGGERLLLASAAQDRYVRIWSIREAVPSTNGVEDGPNPPSTQLARLAPSSLFRTTDHTFSITLESLLIGHEDWVHSIAWHPKIPINSINSINSDNSEHLLNYGNNNEQKMSLISASMDRTMIVWEFDGISNLWINKESVGDAGSTALGYFGGVFSPNGMEIMAHGFTGALHHWKRSDGTETGDWVPVQAMTGHYGEVVDLCWKADSDCLLTASVDQTARIFTEVNERWCEIARPSVHGHDFYSLTFIPSASDPFQYASCSEEKVIRIFASPQTFHQTMAGIFGQEITQNDQLNRPLGAKVKALGLTNKAVFENENNDHLNDDNDGIVGIGAEQYADGPDFAPNATPIAVTEPPLEEHLSQNTLWPETHKLYGHGDNVFSVASTLDGSFLATSCKAQSVNVAVIWIWDTATWTKIDELKAHTLTVTQMEFSRCGGWLLSVSRDRTFCVFKKNEDGRFGLVKRVMKAHSRIIWGAGWAPDGQLLATGSRDQKLKIWGMSDNGPIDHPVHCVCTFASSVTALAFAPSTVSVPGNCYILAVGLQSGVIEVWGVFKKATGFDSRKLWGSGDCVRHADTVKRVRWQCVDPKRVRMATCSSDHSVRVFEFDLVH